MLKWVDVRIYVIVFIYVISEVAWLFLMKGFYANQFKLFTSSPLAIRSKPAAFLVYPLLLVGLYFLVLKDERRGLEGLLYGTVAYGVYNLTNKATLPGYSWTMVCVDTAWGAFLFGALSFIYNFKYPST